MGAPQPQGDCGGQREDERARGDQEHPAPQPRGPAQVALQRLEREGELAGRSETRRRILFQATQGDLRERWGHRRRERRGSVPQHREGGRDRGLALERPRSAEHLAQDRAEAEDVGARIDGRAVDLFRRHVCRRAGEALAQFVAPGLRPVRGRLQDGDAEIEDLERAVGGDEEVVRLDVAVDDALLVGRGQPARQLQREVQGAFGRKRAASQALAQRLAAQQFLHEVGLAGETPHIVDGDDVGVRERPGGARFLCQPRQLRRIVRSGGEHLDRDLASELDVAGREDPAHAAARELAYEDIPAVERRAGFDAIGRRRTRRAQRFHRRHGLEQRHASLPQAATVLV